MKKNQRDFLKSVLFVCIGVAVTTFVFAKKSYDVPDKPGTPMIEDVWATGCALNYLKPRGDGGSPITRYIIECKSKWYSSWETKGSSPDLKYRVENMQEGTSAEFRVRAENRAGVSEPSDASPEITFKPRLPKPKP